MALIKFTKDAETFTFSKQRSYPVEDPLKLNVVTDLSEGGVMYAYNKGISEQYFDLNFKGLSSDDKDNLLEWWEDIAVGATNTFTYTDRKGANHTVRWVDEEFFVTIDEGSSPDNFLYSARLRLRKEV